MLNTKDTYDDSRTQVKKSVGFTGKIAVTLGLLHAIMILTGSLPTYLHQITTPLVYAVCRRDDGAGQPTRREHVEIKLDELRRAMEERGLKISRNNTEYLGTTSTKTQRSIYWEILKESEDIHDFGG